MPYKSEKQKLPPELDRRRKLNDEHKDEIKHKYGTGLYSLNGLAKEYNVSKKQYYSSSTLRANGKMMNASKSIGVITCLQKKNIMPL